MTRLPRKHSVNDCLSSSVQLVAEPDVVTATGFPFASGKSSEVSTSAFFSPSTRMTGELEFKDCVVAVSDKRSVSDEDGLIGADVFGSYLIDIDLPGTRLKLSPLPKRPEDAVAPTSLNSEGEEQANTEQKEDSATGQVSNEQKPSAPTPKIAHRLPKDRYIAPEMADWAKVFRFGHNVLVPTIAVSTAK
jgi:hypothetical protein